MVVCVISLYFLFLSSSPWSGDTSVYRHTSFVLHFIAHHRCFFFYKLKARPSSTSKKITTQFIAIFNFSGPEPNLQYPWHMPVLNPSPVEEYLGYFQFGAVTWLKLLYTVMYTFLCKHKFSFIWDKCLGVQIQGCVVVAYLMF